jgi:glycosyltransferase involved in cell wall biosynthesis
MDFVPRGTRSYDHLILAQAEEMAARRWTVRFAFSGEPPSAFAERLAAIGADYTIVPFPFRWRSVSRLARRWKGAPADVTMTSFVTPFCRPLWGLKLLGLTRRIVILDQTSGVAPRRSGLKRALAAARGKVAGTILDAVAAVSEVNGRRDVERVFLPAAKVLVVPNGIRVADFPAPRRTGGTPIHIAYAGQLIAEKGVATLLRAFARLQTADLPPLELSIAGKGNQDQALRELAASLGLHNVRFLGHIDSIPALFAAADLVVVPSEWAEAFGFTIAEAMACRAACVVSDAGACAEVVGEAGRVFRAGDDADLAANLRQLIDDPPLRRQLGDAARARVEMLFDQRLQVRRLADLCEEILVGRLPQGPSRERRANGESPSTAGGAEAQTPAG